MDGGVQENQQHAVLRDLAARMGHGRDDRLPSAFIAIVSRIHDLLSDLRPSTDELRAVIEFLTDVGHSADARRQEWVLLADVIGVSTRVEELNSPRPEGATPNTLPGPFYRKDVPDVECGANLSRDGVGETLRVRLQVEELSGQPVPQALVEVWHANSLGRYENQDPDLQPEFNLRGRLRSDAEGRVHFLTVKPRGYSLPEDGPVGRLLNALGLKLERPAHLHFRISAEGFETLTTHVFDRKDPAIGHDALFGVRPELLADFRPSPEGPGGPQHALDLVFVLVPSVSPGAECSSAVPASRKDH